MPVLHLNDVAAPLYERIRRLAAAHNRTLEAEALALLEQALLAGASQAGLLEQLRRRRFTPPAGTPDSVELLREDRDR